MPWSVPGTSANPLQLPTSTVAGALHTFFLGGGPPSPAALTGVCTGMPPSCTTLHDTLWLKEH